MDKTRVTLLSRLRRPGSESAWTEFYRVYGPVILSYARRRGLDAARAEDVLQETMVILLRVMPNFRYDPDRGLFRNFLLNIVHQRLLATWRRLGAQREVSLADVEVPEATTSADPGRDLDLLWLASLRDEAWRRVAADPGVARRTLDVYTAYVQQEQPVDEVARRFDLKPNAIYQIKNRLEQRLLAEMQQLRAGLGETAT